MAINIEIKIPQQMYFKAINPLLSYTKAIVFAFSSKCLSISFNGYINATLSSSCIEFCGFSKASLLVL